MGVLSASRAQHREQGWPTLPGSLMAGLATLFMIRSSAWMQRLSEEQLRQLALDAVEEAAAASHRGPVPRSHALALALAWLRHRGAGELLPLWPFKSFWEALPCPREHDRWSAVNASANAIYLALGLSRDPARVSRFEREQALRE